MIRTRDIGVIRDPGYGLRFLLSTLASQAGLDGHGEAPAFYETITIRHWGSGLRQKTFAGSPYGLTVYESVDYDETKTFTRIPLNTDVIHGVSYTTDYGKIDIFDRATGDPPGDGLFKAGLYRIPNYSVPDLRRHYVVPFFEGTTGGVVIGTRTINYADPAETDVTEDIEASFDFLPWEWVADPNPTVNLNDPWDLIWFPTGGGGFASIRPYPASSITNWRDIRGTYSFSWDDTEFDGSWDSNDVEHNTSYTLS